MCVTPVCEDILLGGFIQLYLQIGMGQIQLREGFPSGQGCKQILNAWQWVNLELGCFVYGQLIVATDLDCPIPLDNRHNR